MTGYDVIGDVHGHVEQLTALLEQLGYRSKQGAWSHDERMAIFVGDLIDRRRDRQLDTLRVVRNMVDAGSALVVLGNHEFNAVAYATVDPAHLDYCRPHSAKNRKQHRKFLDEVGFGSPLHSSILAWFREMPLWLDLDGLRVVHACWSPDDIAHLSRALDEDATLNDRVVIEGTTKGHRTYEAIENVLKGPEVDLKDACYYDKDGNRRKRARVRWWDPNATTLAAAVWIPNGTTLLSKNQQTLDALPDRGLEPGEVPRYTDAIPVVFGHYWFSGKPTMLGRTAVCVDYSVDKGGPLVAYRWSGERRLVARNLVSC